MVMYRPIASVDIAGVFNAGGPGTLVDTFGQDSGGMCKKGPPGGSGSGTTSADLGIINVKTDYGALGDGVADDTAAIQAAIDAGLANRKPVYLPAGRYNISSPLILGSNDETSATGTIRGWSMFGINDGQDLNQGGTVIRYVGTATLNCMISLSLWRACHLHDFSLVNQGSGVVTYGILMPDSNISGVHLTRISIWNCGTVICQMNVNGSNGEFLHAQSVSARNADCFWRNHAGQGFVHSFINCGAGLNPGGTYFDIASDGPDGGAGGGLVVWQFSGTGTAVAGGDGHSNTTLLRNNNGTSCISFIGGRVEHIGRLYYQVGGTTQAKCCPVFKGMEFTVRNDPTSSFNTLKNFINIGGGNFDLVTVENCTFSAYITPTKDTLNYGGVGNNLQYWSGFVDWRNCVFNGIVSPATPTPDTYNPNTSLPPNVKFTNCHTSNPSTLGQYRDYLLDGIGSFTDLSGFTAVQAPIILRLPTEPNSTDLGYYTTLIDALNTAGLLAKLDALFILAAPTSDNALTNLIQRPFGLTVNGSPTFTAYRGYTFNGSNTYLESGFNQTKASTQFTPNAKWQLNSAAYFVWPLSTAATGAALGSGNTGTSTRTTFYPALTGNYQAYINSTTVTAGASANTSGLWLVSRTASNSVSVYRNGGLLTTAAPVQNGFDNGSMSIGYGDQGSSFFNGQIAAAGWGSSLSGTDSTNLYNALFAFLHSVGAV